MKAAKVLLVSTVLAGALVHGEEYGKNTQGLLSDEITRHVIDECNLMLIHGKNKVDFDPIQVAVEILPKIHQKLWTKKNQLEREIRTVVYPIKSFSRRARIYDAYYALCIGKISITDAEEQILQYGQMPLASDDMNDDSIIYKLYDPMAEKLRLSHDDIKQRDKLRVARDESRIRILERMNENEGRTYVSKKNSSVIQEYQYNIELWEF